MVGGGVLLEGDFVVSRFAGRGIAVKRLPDTALIDSANPLPLRGRIGMNRLGPLVALRSTRGSIPWPRWGQEALFWAMIGGCRWMISRARESGMSESDRCAGGFAIRACDAGADLSISCSSSAPCDGNASNRNACEIGV